jgi:hypothetical protein
MTSPSQNLKIDPRLVFARRGIFLPCEGITHKSRINLNQLCSYLKQNPNSIAVFRLIIPTATIGPYVRSILSLQLQYVWSGLSESPQTPKMLGVFALLANLVEFSVTSYRCLRLELQWNYVDGNIMLIPRVDISQFLVNSLIKSIACEVLRRTVVSLSERWSSIFPSVKALNVSMEHLSI